MTTGQHQATGHLAATLVTTIIQTSELSINYVLPPQRRHGGLVVSLVIRPSSEIYWKFIHLFHFSTWSWICQETNKVHLF